MVTIQFTQYEKVRLLKVLEKSIKYRIRDYEKGKITKQNLDYDVDRINELIDRVNGKNHEGDYFLNSWKYEDNSSNKNKEKEIINPEELFKRSLF